MLIIDAGLGNIGSAVAAFQRESCLVHRVENPPSVEATGNFTHVVLPGVGSFANGMQSLQASGWDIWIKDVWLGLHRPFLGICLGMQLLATEGSEGVPEGSVISGLNVIPGRVDRFNATQSLVLPHVGWNSLNWQKPSTELANGMPQGGDMYFVHSYIFQPSDSTHGLAFSEYGQAFTAVVGRGSCFGVQFHPEKSQRLGRILLRNFLSLPSLC